MPIFKFTYFLKTNPDEILHVEIRALNRNAALAVFWYFHPGAVLHSLERL